MHFIKQLFVARSQLEATTPKFKPAKVKQLKVLDSKTAQNICESIEHIVISTLQIKFYIMYLYYSILTSPIAILLGTLRMEYQDVRSLVLSCDGEKLTEQLLEQLAKYMPGKDEMIQLMAYRDKMNDLSEAERFGVVVSISVSIHNYVPFIHTHTCTSTIIQCI